VWLLSSVLVTAHAVAIGASVFIVLGAIQIVATALIVVCAIRYKDTPCPIHLPRQPIAKTAAETGTSGKDPGSWYPAGRPMAEPATRAGHGRAPRVQIPVLHPHSHPVTEVKATHFRGRT
jgi:hypothetical protein